MSKRKAILIVSAAIVAIASAWAGIAVLVFKEMVTDYSNLPPAVVFEDLLGTPLPATVKSVQTSGYGLGGGQPVCIKFEVDPANLQWMQHRFTPIDAKEFRRLTEPLPNGTLGDWNRRGRQKLGCECRWEEEPWEFFRVEYVSPPAVWLGVAALDRRKARMCVPK